ncbi:MAG: shikimate kinase [Actinomycetia bacterium]|nr:shikimate kinase [Actinomycetes bacterium]
MAETTKTADTKKLTRNIAFIGFMGSGKTSVSSELAKRLDTASLDTDKIVEALAGMSVAQIFETGGESAFRTMETNVLGQALTMGQPTPVACGGGAILDPVNVELLKDHAYVIYLKVDPDQIRARIDDPSTRPLIKAMSEPNELAELLASREVLYEDAADTSIDTTGFSIAEVVDRVEAILADESLGLLEG